MRRELVFGTVAAVLFAGIGTGVAQAQARPDIIGGQFDSAPWSADVHFQQNGAGYLCSGAIIAPQWVLTAKHCLGDEETVYIGNPALKAGTKAVSDKSYTDKKGDVALLHLSTAVTTTYLGVGSADPAAGETVQIWGWGDTEPGGHHSDRLKSGHMKVQATTCHDHGSGPALCLVAGPDLSAHGDSGGPAVYHGVEVGLDSQGDDTTKDYASLAAHRQWIKATAGV
ncbi:trypsin-like serine protease [Amycolatopsis sp. PS_44_ISF1]|uniref:S1 family peptidase n=1 Tax=Amycolatopsis sp. PS_44_ISF1 TaxID=2974917 RepID=UPI0028DD9C6C|nr:trypsin-like serine protease [Amycolatopsis sp. PS_44_ISF1]MDT8912469.1 trypsin-like serine protease [Amycolatopsis sp. PS_44_ISF1]